MNGREYLSEQNARLGQKKIFLSILGFFTLSLFLFILAFTQNAAAADCGTCHSTYASEISSSNTYHSGVERCIFCHASYSSTTFPHPGTTVNESNTCRDCGHRDYENGFFENHSTTSDCTACHFANTTQAPPLPITSKKFKHNHNLTIEYNFYNYNQSGFPVRTNNGAGYGMFPYYTCTLTCHKYNATTGVEGKIDEAAKSWFNSSHARSLHMSGDNEQSCAKCKSPPNYNISMSASATITQADWQGIQCRVCHNLHDRYFPNRTGPRGFPIAFYNSTLSSQNGHTTYQQLNNSTQLCEKCHLTFNDDINSTYNMNYGGSHRSTVRLNCTDCHMNSTFNNDLHLFEVKNTTSGVTGCQVCHNYETSHTNFTQKIYHDNKVDCVACHDQTFTVNASGYAVFTFPNNSNYSYGLWNVSGNWTIYQKKSSTSIKSWPLHNITRTVTCVKCHNATSAINGTIASALVCSSCHSSYASDVNSSTHNKTRNERAPDCTDCHAGYVPSYGHDSGNRNFIVNESNACRNCHNATSGNLSVNESHGNHYYGQDHADCTQCHFANTTQIFNMNNSLFIHDHNLTVEYNFYNYNISGMPTNSSRTGKGMFPYFTCTLTCHGTGSYSIEDEVVAWNKSSHARAPQEATLTNSTCITCHSPAQYDTATKTIAASGWKGIQCNACHNLHNDTYSGNGTSPINFAFLNATLTNGGSPVYDKMTNATQLCESCHIRQSSPSHNARFYGGDHRLTANFTCISCHANSTFNNESHLFEVKNTTSGVTGCEVCHNYENSHADFIKEKHNNSNVQVQCEACHDNTISRNGTGYAAYSYNSAIYGIYKNTSNIWVTYKYRRGTLADWSLHNISKSVSCNKCHNTTTIFNGTTLQDKLIAPALACANCHSTYVSAVNSSNHNRTLNSIAPDCTDCHNGYQPQWGHTTGRKGYIVNETNSCRNCHNATSDISPVNESHGNHNYGQNHSDCTQCHFANTTQNFSLNRSLFTHDHNLTVEYNFYNYNISGMPLGTNNGTGKGMFPYYTCTLTCHNGIGLPKIENETIAWNQSGHAQVTSEADTYNMTCLRCHSPAMYNGSNTATIATSVKQGIQCRVCHNLHNDTYSGNGTPAINIAFYNATLSNSTGSPVYDTVDNTTELCEKCHKGGYHNTSRDIYYNGTHKTSLGFTCADCHMNLTINNGSTHKFDVKNNITNKTGCEACHEPISVHANPIFREYSSHLNVTCDACHDGSFARNSTDYLVNVSTGMVSGGIYKNPVTNKWTTYRASTSTRTGLTTIYPDWAFHNISNNIIDCNKCHGAKSVFNGSIASNLTIGGITYSTTVPLISGYNLIFLTINPDPAINASNFTYISPGGITGVTKVMKWNSTAQKLDSYEYFPATGVTLGTNFTLEKYTSNQVGYYLLGNASTIGKTFTFRGIK